MASCNNLPSTVAPDSLGTDSPPPPAYIRNKTPPPGPDDKLFDKCNKSLWIRFRQPDGVVEVNGKVHVAKQWPVDVDQYEDIINRKARKYWVPAAWIAAFIAQESRGETTAVSYAGANGLMQILVSSAKWLSDPAFPSTTKGHVGPSAGQLADPELNVELGTKYLRWLADKHGDNIPLMAGQYSSGKAKCGPQDPGPGRDECASPSPHDWGLVTHCGYIDKIIGYTNLAIERGYFGVREVDLGGGHSPDAGASVLSVLLGLGLGAGAVYATTRLLK